MSPTTRAGSKRASALSEHPELARKRQKKNDDATVAAPEAPNPIPSTMENKTKNTHLKGRKRFAADLEDVKQASKQGFVVNGLVVKHLRAGDDEGSIEFTVLEGERLLASVNLLVSDTSEYPEDHTFYAFSPDADIPQTVLDVIQDVSNQRSRTIHETVRRLTFDLARLSDPYAQDSRVQDEEDDADSDEEMPDYDEDLDYEFGNSDSKTTRVDPERLQHDFLSTIVDDYRPGLIRFSGDEFALTVSLPIVSLAKRISPRVLMAWDRRLLARTQHLTLIISGLRGTYPVLKPDGTYQEDAVRHGATLVFKVGLSPRYKPSKEHTAELVRNFGLVVTEEDEVKATDVGAEDLFDEDPSIPYDEDGMPIVEDPLLAAAAQREVEEQNDPGRFERFSLSASLESLLENRFLRVLQLRIKFRLGWAGAETLLAEVESSQRGADVLYPQLKKALQAADKREKTLTGSYALPFDPLKESDENAPINLPQVAFSYLLRRLMLCTRYCLVCHNTLSSEYEVIKPYVCDSKLCSYQYYNLNRGPSLEYEICHNTETVDLLVSLAYSAAIEGALEDPLPVGLGLRVPAPSTGYRSASAPHGVIMASGAQQHGPPANPLAVTGPDGLCDFDVLPIEMMRAAIVMLIDSLPAIKEMKAHLEKRVNQGQTKPKLFTMNSKITPAAWSVLRWCIGSCTAHLEELNQSEDKVQNIDSSWRQFRFSVGAPDAEATFKTAVDAAKTRSSNAKKYPSLFAFHGSALKNWHSIIRHGLWFKQVVNGRAYGNGVYFAKDGQLSMGTYATPGQSWRNSEIGPRSCVALAEIVNLPQNFVSSNPYFVVSQTSWIICRYLLVNSSTIAPYSQYGGGVVGPLEGTPISNIPYVPLDPAHPLTLSQKRIAIPQPSYKLETLIKARNSEYVEEENDEDDVSVFSPPPVAPSHSQSQSQKQREVIEIEDSPEPPPRRVEDSWVHDPEWVNQTVGHMMPPPREATPMATMSLQRELKAMLREQDQAKSLSELGWYMPTDFIGDNLFQWIVELHSFEKDLPIAKDLKSRKINSLVFEIRFPPTYPHSPPFFRIIKPRLLPFIQGGGGHVTGGGSMCMDLLTSDGWLPSYSISAVLLQIKLAISNLEPRPARLSAQFDIPYGTQEALEGFKRAAATHGWKVPQGTEALLR